MDEGPRKPKVAGLPAWLATFADLMTLLMCFFVLLLSFSEMDRQKFKQVAGSMEKAFGVQKNDPASESPKGTSILTRDFSSPQVNADPSLLQIISASESKEIEEQAKIKSIVSALETSLELEERQGIIEIGEFEDKILIRIAEKGSFESGLAKLKPEFQEALHKIYEVLKTLEGELSISGHSDDLPIFNSQFTSNWALSSQRAIEVTHALLDIGKLPDLLFSVRAYADTRPLYPNDTVENRRKNRRVEILFEPVEARKLSQDWLQDSKQQPASKKVDFKSETLELNYDQLKSQDKPFKSWEDWQNKPLQSQ